MMTDKEFNAACQHLRETAAQLQDKLTRSALEIEQNQGRLANMPPRRYHPEDRIELVRQPNRPASTRAAVKGINVPADGETWQELNQWRARYGLPPVTR